MENEKRPTHHILIDFDPLQITLPGAGPFAGEVRLILPEFRIRLHDLSMGGIVPDEPYIGGDGRLFRLKLIINEPGISASDLLSFIESAQDELREVHQIVQQELDKRYLLD